MPRRLYAANIGDHRHRQGLPPAASIAPYPDRRRPARQPTDGLQTADNCPTLLPMPLGAMLPIVRAWRPSAWSACAYNRYCYRLQAYSPRKRLPLPPQVSPEPSIYEYSRQDTTGQHSSAPTTHTRKRLSPPPLAPLPLLPAITSRKHDRPPECVRASECPSVAPSIHRRKRPSVQPSGDADASTQGDN